MRKPNATWIEKSLPEETDEPARTPGGTGRGFAQQVCSECSMKSHQVRPDGYLICLNCKFLTKLVPVKQDRLAALSVHDLAIAHGLIPEIYPNKEYWQTFQAEWFFVGLKECPEFMPGIETKEALAHMYEIQKSRHIKHEHKKDCVAYLLSIWAKKPGI